MIACPPKCVAFGWVLTLSLSSFTHAHTTTRYVSVGLVGPPTAGSSSLHGSSFCLSAFGGVSESANASRIGLVVGRSDSTNSFGQSTRKLGRRGDGTNSDVNTSTRQYSDSNIGDWTVPPCQPPPRPTSRAVVWQLGLPFSVSPSFSFFPTLISNIFPLSPLSPLSGEQNW